ncbi:MAG TPA: hypothetical protein VM097_08990 [Mycobacteriales bacterium]|nr:hypothetical protein [Mycobacteriales bacterium]
MHLPRLTAVIVLGLTTVLVAPAGAGTTPQVLRGTTVITADRSGSADLVLYDDAVMRLNADYTTPDITMTGPGRIIGFSLSLDNGDDGMGASRYRRAGKVVNVAYAAGTTYPRPASCDTYAGVTVPMTLEGVFLGCPAEPAPKYTVLHQGHYHLRVLTDGGRVTITLRLRGVPGSARLRPTKALASGVQVVGPRDDLGGRFVRRETVVAPGVPASALINIDADFAAKPVAAGVTTCVYDAAKAQLPTDYTTTQCPGGRSGGFPGVILNPTMSDYDPNRLFSLTYADLAAAPARVGFSAQDEGGVTVRGALLAWLQSES